MNFTKKFSKNKGITLIALVVTIIVLLILAGISISMLTGQNGILNRATEAKQETGVAQEEEQVKLAVMSALTEGTGTLTIPNLKKELADYGITIAEYATFPVTVSAGGKSYTIDATGEVSTGGSSVDPIPTPDPTDKISKDTSYVGYYADIDADGTVDGVIYADLAVGNQGSGQWGKYTIPTVTEGLKDYYISQTNYKVNEGFGTKDVISPTGTGTERFYIMALTNITKNGAVYDWYNAALSKMSDYPETTSGDFGKGKSNTTTMISKWNAKAYGDQDKCSYHKDMWGQIQEEVNNGWFVPSRAEWSAFGGELGITVSNYENFGLSDYYWSSSQSSTTSAWGAYFYLGWTDTNGVSAYTSVRMGATF